MTTVELRDCDLRTQELVKLAHSGDEVVFSEDGKALARIIPMAPPASHPSSTILIGGRVRTRIFPHLRALEPLPTRAELAEEMIGRA